MQYTMRSLLLILIVAIMTACGGSNKFKVMDRKGQFAQVPVRVLVTDLEDKRPFEQGSNVGITMIPIFGLWGGYYQDRHDDFFGGVTIPFRRTIAKQLAKRLADAGVFAEVKYVAPDALPPKGDYDIIVTGTLNKLQSRGAYTRYGLSFIGDLLWELGLPKFNRRWVADVDFRLVNGYTGEQIGKDKKVAYATSRKWFTTYYNRGRTSDLERKTTPMYDELVDWIWTNQPKGDDEYWATLKKEGEIALAQARLVDEQAKKGTPPTFTFLSPTAGTELRGASADVRWAITAPGGLKSITLVSNNVPVALPIDVLAMANPETAPKSIAAQDVKVPLALGSNKLEALVIDHRGNDTRASMELNRLPAELNPSRRFALLIGSGSEEAKASIDAVKQVLVEPLLGQFSEENVVTLKADNLSKEELTKVAKQFGSEPLAGNLAFIYLATNGEWDGLKVGGDGMTLNELVATLTSSLATNEVVLLADIDWSGTGPKEDISARLPELPARWGFFTAQPNGEAMAKRDGKSLFAEAFVSTIKGKEGSTARLTLERLFDGLVVMLEDESGGKLKPAVYGRFNPSISMVERE